MVAFILSLTVNHSYMIYVLHPWVNPFQWRIIFRTGFCFLMTPMNIIYPQAFRHSCQSFFRTQKSTVHVNEHDWAARWLVDWLLRIRACEKFCTKTISINKFSSERVDSYNNNNNNNVYFYILHISPIVSWRFTILFLLKGNQNNQHYSNH